MVATTATETELLPNAGLTVAHFVTAATADSANTLDLSGTFSDIKLAIGYLDAIGAILVTNSSGILTIDSGGGRTDNAYELIVVGVRKQK